MDELLPEIEAGTPIVVLEPSCASVFRDELTNLFPKDERAQALSKQVFLLSEFLEKHANNDPSRFRNSLAARWSMDIAITRP